MASSVIAKKIPNTNFDKGKPDRIRGLIDYILAPETDMATEKCVHWNEQGFGVRDGTAIKQQMILAAELATRSPDTVAHYVISWDVGLAPSNDQIDEAASELLAALGASEHRAVWAAHSDSGNVHFHVVLDRVHPLTDKVLDLYRDVPKIHQAAKRIAEIQGWGPVVDSRYTISPEKAKDWEPAPSQRALLMEHKTGQISAESFARAAAPKIIASAKTWDELHNQFAQLGMTYMPQGSGAVIRIGHTGVKASRVSRSASRSRLEKQLGAFREPGTSLATTHNKQQLAEFMIARDAHQASQREERRLLGMAQSGERKQLRDHFGTEYRAIIGDRSIPWKKRDMMRRVLAAQRAKAMASLIEKHRLDRAIQRKGQERFPKYQDWKQSKDQQHSARSAPQATGTAGGGQSGTAAGRPEAIDIRGYQVTIAGDEVIYTLTGRTRPSMIDHGRSLTIYDADDAAIRAMLQLANARWGGLQLNRASPELMRRFAEIAKAEHFVLYDQAGAAASPGAERRTAPGRASPATSPTSPRTPRRP